MIGDAFHLYMVCPGMSIVRVEKPAVHFGLVGKQKQSLGVHIQPTQGVHIRGETELGEGSLTRLVGGELAKDAIRLVKRNDQWDALSVKAPPSKQRSPVGDPFAPQRASSFALSWSLVTFAPTI